MEKVKDEFVKAFVDNAKEIAEDLYIVVDKVGGTEKVKELIISTIQILHKHSERVLDNDKEFLYTSKCIDSMFSLSETYTALENHTPVKAISPYVFH